MFVTRRTHEKIVHGYERQVASQQRIIEQLCDRLMYQSGSMWTPPPSNGEEPLVLADPEAGWTFDPEQG